MQLRIAKRRLVSIEETVGIAPRTLYNVEHVVPRKYAWPALDRDMHNLVLLDARLNALRDIKRLTVPLVGATHIRDEAGDWYVHPFGFTPAASYRGRYARACAYALTLRPDAIEWMPRRVIDLTTMLRWHEMHPACEAERQAAALKCEEQGQTHNAAVHDPGFVPWLVARHMG
jgi:hypothetical protein